LQHVADRGNFTAVTRSIWWIALAMFVMATAVTALIAWQLRASSAKQTSPASDFKNSTGGSAQREHSRLPRRKEDNGGALMAMLPAIAAAPSHRPDPETTAPNSPAIVAMIDIYNDAASPSDTVRGLAQLLPTLTPEDQGEAARYMVAAAADADYGEVTAVLLGDQLGTEASQVLIDDVAQRPPSVSNPVWAELAQRPQHPFHSMALQQVADQQANRPLDPR